MNKSRIIGTCDAAPFSMPCLENKNAPKNRDEIMREIEEMQRLAYEEGFASGEKAGFEEGKHKISVLAERLARIIDEISGFKNNLVMTLEQQVVDLAVAMGRKVIHEEISKRPDIIVTIVKEALKRLQRVGTITIKVNPVLYDMFMENKSELDDIHKDIVFDVSSNVSVTGPLVISESEEVVTDINSMIANIIEELNMLKPKALADNSGEPVTASSQKDNIRQSSGDQTAEAETNDNENREE